MTTPSTNSTLRHAARVAALGLIVAAGACDEPESFESEERGALMFGLEDADVEQIHADYLEGEDIQITTDRLTAPFDCTLFGDLCDVVGSRGAKTLTGEIVDLALDGVSDETIETHIDLRVDELADELDSHADDDVHRAAGPYSYADSPSGNHRIRTRSGIFTPAVGLRRAWTRVDAFARVGQQWISTQGTLCVDVGPNTQTRIDHLEGLPGVGMALLESFSSSACENNAHTYTQRTFHARNTGLNRPGTVHLPALTRRYAIESIGSVSATVAGWSASIVGSGHAETF
ncbi:MAG: hypothetical protein KUG77_09440 [Nannocystaceae bacterium]|nr:hypothetical protein [Nannocystaceae bacterium]